MFVFMRVHRAVAALAVAAFAMGCRGAADATTGATGDAATDTVTDAATDDADAASANNLDLDLGHVEPIAQVLRDGHRALSLDSGDGYRHWVLWDLDTREQVASGDVRCTNPFACPGPSALRGGKFLLLTNDGFEVRSAVDGALIGAGGVPNAPSGLATDGSYVWAAGQTALNVWRPDGGILVERAGAYRHALVFAAPGELRIARGPAAGMIESISIPDGTVSTVSHPGVFHSWFLDGAHFLATSGDQVRVVNLDGNDVGVGMVTTTQVMHGQGEHLWTFQGSPSYQLDIYTVAPFERVRTYSLASGSDITPSGDSIGILETQQSSQSFSIINLGPNVTRSPPIALPVTAARTFVADDAGWMVGNYLGVVVPGTGTIAEAPLSNGAPLSTSGAASGVAALATASGSIFVLEVGEPSSVVRTVPQVSSHVELSSDGTRLLAGSAIRYEAQYRDDITLRLYDVGTGAVTYAWPHRISDLPRLMDYTFASAGGIVAQYYLHAPWPAALRRRIFRTDGTELSDYGGAVTFNTVGIHNFHLFPPDGRGAALTPAYEYRSQATTTIYRDGAAVRTVDGVALGWISDDRLLVARYRFAGGNSLISILDETVIYDGGGVVVATAMLPDLLPSPINTPWMEGTISPAGGGLVYSPKMNAVYDPMAATPVWQGPPADPMALVQIRGLATAGDFVLYLREARVVVERFRT